MRAEISDTWASGFSIAISAATAPGSKVTWGKRSDFVTSATWAVEKMAEFAIEKAKSGERTPMPPNFRDLMLA